MSVYLALFVEGGAGFRYHLKGPNFLLTLTVCLRLPREAIMYLVCLYPKFNFVAVASVSGYLSALANCAQQLAFALFDYCVLGSCLRECLCCCGHRALRLVPPSFLAEHVSLFGYS